MRSMNSTAASTTTTWSMSIPVQGHRVPTATKSGPVAQDRRPARRYDIEDHALVLYVRKALAPQALRRVQQQVPRGRPPSSVRRLPPSIRATSSIRASASSSTTADWVMPSRATLLTR